MNAIGRLSVRERPAGLPLLRQRWSHLAFVHRPAAASAVPDTSPAVHAQGEPFDVGVRPPKRA